MTEGSEKSMKFNDIVELFATRIDERFASPEWKAHRHVTIVNRVHPERKCGVGCWLKFLPEIWVQDFRETPFSQAHTMK